MRRINRIGPLALLAAWPLIGGCNGLTINLPGGSITIPGLNTVVIEVFNDTDYEIDPRIRFNSDTGFFAGLFGGEDLQTGILEPGQVASFNFDCDAVGVIFSDRAGQFRGNDTIGQGDRTRTLERDDDFNCGDAIRFHFVGNGDGFGAVVSVNNVVVD